VLSTRPISVPSTDLSDAIEAYRRAMAFLKGKEESFTANDIQSWENEENVKGLRTALRSPDDYLAWLAALALCRMGDQRSARRVRRLLDSGRLDWFRADDLRSKLDELEHPRPPLPTFPPLTEAQETEAEIERLEKQIRELDKGIEAANDEVMRARRTDAEEHWSGVEQRLSAEREPLVARLAELKRKEN
jgi:hypothetical protein